MVAMRLLEWGVDPVEKERLVKTLPDGRHRTVLTLLLQKPKVREHLRRIVRIVRDSLQRESAASNTPNAWQGSTSMRERTDIVMVEESQIWRAVCVECDEVAKGTESVARHEGQKHRQATGHYVWLCFDLLGVGVGWL